MKTTHAIAVPFAPDAVFGFLAHVANETQWRQSVVGSRYVGADAPQLGVEGETDVEMGGKGLTMRWDIVEFIEGSHVAWRLDGEPWRGGGSYTVTPDGAGTRILAALEVRLTGAARVFEPLIGVQLRSGLRSDLARLADLLPTVLAEAEAEAPAE